MKAIGLPNREIGPCTGKYRALALVGCLPGGLAALGAGRRNTTGSLRVNYASAPLEG